MIIRKQTETAVVTAAIALVKVWRIDWHTIQPHMRSEICKLWRAVDALQGKEHTQEETS